MNLPVIKPFVAEMETTWGVVPFGCSKLEIVVEIALRRHVDCAFLFAQRCFLRSRASALRGRRAFLRMMLCAVGARDTRFRGDAIPSWRLLCFFRYYVCVDKGTYS